VPFYYNSQISGSWYH